MHFSSSFVWSNKKNKRQKISSRRIFQRRESKRKLRSVYLPPIARSSLSLLLILKERERSEGIEEETNRCVCGCCYWSLSLSSLCMSVIHSVLLCLVVVVVDHKIAKYIYEFYIENNFMIFIDGIYIHLYIYI